MSFWVKHIGNDNGCRTGAFPPSAVPATAEGRIELPPSPKAMAGQDGGTRRRAKEGTVYYHPVSLLIRIFWLSMMIRESCHLEGGTSDIRRSKASACDGLWYILVKKNPVHVLRHWQSLALHR
jgi:hypothetical protein